MQQLRLHVDRKFSAGRKAGYGYRWISLDIGGCLVLSLLYIINSLAKREPKESARGLWTESWPLFTRFHLNKNSKNSANTQKQTQLGHYLFFIFIFIIQVCNRGLVFFFFGKTGKSHPATSGLASQRQTNYQRHTRTSTKTQLCGNCANANAKTLSANANKVRAAAMNQNKPPANRYVRSVSRAKND